MKKRATSILMVLVLLLGLFPTTASAADAPWAEQAVDTLNEIYDTSVFSASTDEMTEGDAYGVLNAMGAASSEVSADSSTKLTRGTACDILADIFKLDTGDDSAIQYLYNEGIINGFQGSTDLQENGAVTKAQFAVLTYRVLNVTGGGAGSSIDGLMPGTDEYFAWIYLMANGCLDYTDADDSPATDNPDDDMDEGTLTRWKTQLKTEQGITIETDMTKADAAASFVVDALGITQIFSDVAPGAWYYDGVMYLFDHGIVRGYANGTFGAEDKLTRAQLATLLWNLSGNPSGSTLPTDVADIEDTAWYKDAAAWALSKNMMSLDAENKFNATDLVTKADAVVAVMKQQNANVSDVSTAILSRFSDTTNFDETTAKCLAYAVSLGLLNGTAQGALGADGVLTRGAMGVFLYRTLLGADTTKMQDYTENVGNALGITQ